jgi:integrase
MAGLGDVHFHDLRHTFASHLIQNTGGDLKAVQDLMRHKDIRMTMRYAHLSPGYLRQATLTLDRTFGNLGASAAPQAPLGAMQQASGAPKAAAL